MKIITSGFFILISLQLCFSSTERVHSDTKDSSFTKIISLSPDGDSYFIEADSSEKSKQINNEIKTITKEVCDSLRKEVTILRHGQMTVTIPLAPNIPFDDQVDFSEAYADEIRSYFLKLPNITSELEQLFFPQINDGNQEEQNNNHSLFAICQEFLPINHVLVNDTNIEEADIFIKNLRVFT